MEATKVTIRETIKHLSGFNNPPDPPDINGLTSGKAGTSYTYTFNAVDPDGDDVRYIINWGDGFDTTPFNPSGMDMLVPHTWSNEGTYIIRASAEDTNGLVGPETTLEVNMPRNKPYTDTPFLQLLQNFLEQYPILYQLLQRFLRL